MRATRPYRISNFFRPKFCCHVSSGDFLSGTVNEIEGALVRSFLWGFRHVHVLMIPTVLYGNPSVKVLRPSGTEHATEIPRSAWK